MTTMQKSTTSVNKLNNMYSAERVALGVEAAWHANDAYDRIKLCSDAQKKMMESFRLDRVSIGDEMSKLTQELSRAKSDYSDYTQVVGFMIGHAIEPNYSE
jgi:hypothetical protein